MKTKDITGYPSIDQTHLKGQKYFERNPIIPNMSVFNSLNLLSLEYRKDDAINCHDLTVTYDELIKNAAIISKSFKELGIKKGDIISVAMPNFYQAVAVFLAANRIGATVTFLNPLSSKEEILEYLNLFESPLLVNYDKERSYNESIISNSKVEQVVTLGKKEVMEGKLLEEDSKSYGYDDVLSFRDLGPLSKYYKKPINILHSGNTDALILFTSGTTGNPKSVLLTNKNLLSVGTYLKNSSKIDNTRGEKSLVCVPFPYPYGFATSTLMSLYCGRQAVLCPYISAETINYYLSKEPNIIFGSPALLELIMKNTKEEMDLSSVHTFISGGDFLAPSKIKGGEEFFRKHNSSVIIGNGFGNAETIGSGANPVGVEPRPNTVGKILTGSNAIIVNPDTMEELKYNEEGLLCISGGHVFKEYFKEPRLTEEAKFKYKGKTYFKTGTMGKLDEDGYFTLTGRDSRFYIISSLNKVYCDRVQMIMGLIDCVESVAVVKKPDDEQLFVGKAYVVLKEGIEPTDEVKKYILEKCKEQLILASTREKMQLKEFEIPASIEFIDYIPRTTASEKVDYTLLERLAEEEYSKEKQNIAKLTLK